MEICPTAQALCNKTYINHSYVCHAILCCMVVSIVGSKNRPPPPRQRFVIYGNIRGGGYVIPSL